MPPFLLPGRRDRRLPDDRLHALLRAGESGGVPLSDLCAEHGVSIPEYCVLKKKYGGLSLEALQAARRAEQQHSPRSMTPTGLALVVMLTASAGVYVAWGRDANERAPHAMPRVEASEPLHAAAPSDAAPAAPADRKRTRAAAVAAPAPEEEGYAVQVAALPDARAARLAADALLGRGYPAYVAHVTTAAGDAFRVRVGPFHTRRQAELLLPDLVHDGYDEAWITK